jgi:hypothetical protein
MRFYSAIDPKPERNFCEDIIGHNNGYYWLLDGATPPSSDGGSLLTQEFLRLLSSQLIQLSNDSKVDSPSKLLSIAIQSINNYFQTVNQKDYFPFATAVVLKIDSQRIDYLVIGDSYLLIDIDEKPHIFCDDRLKQIAVDERQKVRQLRESGVLEQDQIYKEARDKLIATEKLYRNKENGFWVVSTDKEAPLHGINGSFDINVDSNILIMAASDGFARLSTHFERPKSLVDLAHQIIAVGASKLLDELRTLEQDKSNFLTPASSKHDDASFMLLYNKGKRL